MGQGASTPQGNERAGRGEGNIASSARDMDTEMTTPPEEGGNGSGGEERTAGLRRRRRLQSHLSSFTAMAERVFPNSLTSRNSESSRSSRHISRLQNRLADGSPPGSRSSSRETRRHSGLSRFMPSRSNSSPVVPITATPPAEEELAAPRFTRRETDPDITASGTDNSHQSRRFSYAGSGTPSSRFARFRNSISGIPIPGHDTASRPRSMVNPSSGRRMNQMDALFDRSDENAAMLDVDIRQSGSSSDDNAPSSNTSENEGAPRGQDGDQQAVLSRLLSVAAAMTAASLVGSDQQALSEARDVGNGTGNDAGNGESSFETFLRALRGGHLAAALRNGGSEMGGGVNGMNGQSGSDGTNGPLNFFRMFRFGPTNNGETENADGTGPRMVPVVIVGIRSVNGNSDPAEATAPFFDAMPTWNNAQGGNNRTFPRSRPSRTRVDPNDPLLRSPRRHSRNAASDHFSSFSPTLSDTQEDPFNTPRPATSGQAERSNNDLNEESHSAPAFDRSGSDDQPPRSSSRRGSGGSTSSGPRRTPEGTRSWIIYVLGGAYPENHPILTTPSLFTDNPTYEDMVLLSSLIGNVKPPVASREDVDRAGGIFTLDFSDVKDPRTATLQGERCLVCLGDYENGEVCRQITSCSHIFHKDCIDEWLTTGRNTCPLCRGEGVERTKEEAAAATNSEQAAAASSATVGGEESRPVS